MKKFEDYNVENLELFNMPQFNKHQDRPHKRDGHKIFLVEKELSIEEKITFIDEYQDGIATYMLNIIKKWDKEKDKLPKDITGWVETASHWVWIKKNDPLEKVNNSCALGSYYLFNTKHWCISNICGKTEDGYNLEYTGEDIVNQWFHDLLIMLYNKESIWFKEHDTFYIKLNRVKEYGEKHNIVFGNKDLNDVVYNNKQDVSEAQLDNYINAYKQLALEIEKISKTIDI